MTVGFLQEVASVSQDLALIPLSQQGADFPVGQGTRVAGEVI